MQVSSSSQGGGPVTLFRFQNGAGGGGRRGDAGSIEATLEDWGNGSWQLVYR